MNKWFCFHKWYPVSVYHFMLKGHGGPCAMVTLHCQECGEVKTKELLGTNVSLLALQKSHHDGSQWDNRSKKLSLSTWMRLAK